jgi:hypothetical protein
VTATYDFEAELEKAKEAAISGNGKPLPEGSEGSGPPKTNGSAEKHRLLIDPPNPDIVVGELCRILAKSAQLYERGGTVVRLVYDEAAKATVAQPMTADSLTLMAHTVCRPYKIQGTPATPVDARLPQYIANMYLNWRGNWDLRSLDGVSTAPLLSDDGTIRAADGYDKDAGLWCENIPDLSKSVPEKPTEEQARAALMTLRQTFQTFCFADSPTKPNGDSKKPPLVDLTEPPGADESAFLAALLTAVCRPSLHLAPGVLLRSPQISGAGTGKGLLARCICMIAFGLAPSAVTGGGPEEMEKRIASELMGSAPILFLDNLNNAAVKSDLLASAITERPARVRVLGRSMMVPLNVSAFIILTGNDLRVTEDLARRFIEIELDSRLEDPETRAFSGEILEECRRRRNELLAACLTIWRWGRQNKLESGLALGSFGRWCEWVRDPLVALGCKDPVERVSLAKQRDSRRQATVEFFTTWHANHGSTPMQAKDLNEDVKAIADPANKGRQFLTRKLDGLHSTRVAGFLFTRDKSAKWSPARYTLTEIEPKQKSEEPERIGVVGVIGWTGTPMTPHDPHAFPQSQNCIESGDPAQADGVADDAPHPVACRYCGKAGDDADPLLTVAVAGDQFVAHRCCADTAR